MFSTRRNRNIKKPSVKRKPRTRRNQRKLKGGTLDKCIQECHAAWPADPLADLPTRDNPTPNGWYITMKDDRYYGKQYALHSIMDPNKSVYELPKLDGGTLWLHNFKGTDLPILDYISREGYVLSIERINHTGPNKLVWKRGHTLIPYLHGGKEPDN